MMKALFVVVLGLAVTAVPAMAAPLPVIFDTDMGNDIDDALALAMLHAFASRGEVRLLAVTVSKDNPWAAEYVRLVDEYYGRGAIPVGIVHDGKTPEDGHYVRQICERHGRHPHPAKIPDAVQLLRKTLARAQDGSVSMIQVGFSTNLARLLTSGPDRNSTLNGRELVKKKVRSLTVMAGDFATAKPEYNVKIDVPAARERADQIKPDLEKRGYQAFEISAATGEGLRPLSFAMAALVAADRAARPPEQPAERVRVKVRVRAADEPGFEVVRLGEDSFLIRGEKPLLWVRQTDFSNDEAVGYLADRLARLGVEQALAEAGAEPGAEVLIGERDDAVVFDWDPAAPMSSGSRPRHGPRGSDPRLYS